MINKIPATPAFKGTISVVAGRRARTGYKAYIFEKERVSLDTEKIESIKQCEKKGYTLIEYPHGYEDCEPFYFVPSEAVSTSDFLAAYNAAKNSNICIELEDKSTKSFI